jgi:phospholipase/lecithinase/hemolysin
MQPMTRFVRSLGAVLLVLLLPQSPDAAGKREGPRFDRYYVFGDSLADTGNVFLTTSRLGIDPAVPPSASPHRAYFNGRFSNGAVAFEYLWQLLGGRQQGRFGGLLPYLGLPSLNAAPAVNFAFGGSGTPRDDVTPGGVAVPGLIGQVEMFRAALGHQKPSKRALYAIVSGANDYLGSPFKEPMSPVDVIRNMADAIEVLYELGARDVIVLDLPNLALLPGVAGQPPEVRAQLAEVTTIHNDLLGAALDALAVTHPDLNLVRVNTNDLFTVLQASMNPVVPALDSLLPPSPLGFPMSACLFVEGTPCEDVPTFVPPVPFLFWDVVHPTTEAHEALAEYIYDQLQP